MQKDHLLQQSAVGLREQQPVPHKQLQASLSSFELLVIYLYACFLHKINMLHSCYHQGKQEGLMNICVAHYQQAASTPVVTKMNGAALFMISARQHFQAYLGLVTARESQPLPLPVQMQKTAVCRERSGMAGVMCPC